MWLSRAIVDGNTSVLVSYGEKSNENASARDLGNGLVTMCGLRISAAVQIRRIKIVR
jgi:hypothetical protein